KIIDLDVFRTRINKENEKTIYFFNLFLNYACSHFQFKYKQGLNEVLALFFYLKGKHFNMVDVYFCFESFVEKNIFLCVDNSNLPELLSKINIFNKKFLKKVWAFGKYLERQTPVSFVHKLFFIKNVLIHLTSENSAENYEKKNVLLNFFKSIDYMSVNSYEILKNLCEGNNKYLFLDIRLNSHFKSFHLYNSINMELVKNYLDIFKSII
ncbi:hypothetical protein C923_04028, partial [Plasmodium falciparum UGT5.1]